MDWLKLTDSENEVTIVRFEDVNDIFIGLDDYDIRLKNNHLKCGVHIEFINLGMVMELIRNANMIFEETEDE